MLSQNAWNKEMALSKVTSYISAHPCLTLWKVHPFKSQTDLDCNLEFSHHFLCFFGWVIWLLFSKLWIKMLIRLRRFKKGKPGLTGTKVRLKRSCKVRDRNSHQVLPNSKYSRTLQQQRIFFLLMEWVRIKLNLEGKIIVKMVKEKKKR